MTCNTLLLKFQGQATDIAIQAEEILNLKKLINNIYVKHTGQPIDVIGRFNKIIIINKKTKVNGPFWIKSR